MRHSSGDNCDNGSRNAAGIRGNAIMREDTLHGVLERHAKLRGDRLAIITETSRWTYGALNEKANQLGRYLRDRGVQPGDRVAVLCRNDEWFALAFFALLKIGAVVVPTNVRLTAHELEQLFTRHHVTGVIYHESLADGLPNCDLRHSYGVYDACEKALSFPGTDLSVARSPKEPCELLFTSGTTGRPKGALFNHERILNTARAIAAEFRVTEKDVWLHLMPLTHAAPLNTFFMSGLVAGTGHVIGDFSPDTFLRWIERERTTLTFAAPVAYLLAARQLADAAYRLDSMRLYAYGGGRCPPPPTNRSAMRFNPRRSTKSTD
ncbi:hypothetical protein GCM10025857_01880 [Alicyclobacillus contaminans]|nr:hypothetical protein GCM10025857_01880 [Alicyclobacillus contaminans]